jgi:N-acetylglucosamine kinase-like BadF-type ATPase
MARGVEVERIFVYEALTPNVVALMREHDAAGVRVLAVAVDGLRAELLIDVCVFDDDRVHEVVFSSGGNAMAYRYSQDRERTALVVVKLERLYRLATPFAELELPV